MRNLPSLNKELFLTDLVNKFASLVDITFESDGLREELTVERERKKKSMDSPVRRKLSVDSTIFALLSVFMIFGTCRVDVMN